VSSPPTSGRSNVGAYIVTTKYVPLAVGGNPTAREPEAAFVDSASAATYGGVPSDVLFARREGRGGIF